MIQRERPDGSTNGIYLAFSTNPTPILVSTSTGLCVTPAQTKIGYAGQGFYARANQYRITFRGKVEFWPIVELPIELLKPVEKAVKEAMAKRYEAYMSTGNGEWFVTSDREAVRELILKTALEFEDLLCLSA